LDALKIEAAADLAGMQKVINDHYSLMQQLELIENEIQTSITINGGEEGFETPTELLIPFPALPVVFSTADEIDAIIRELSNLKKKLAKSTTIRVEWKIAKENGT
jgi:hypothetical protein